MSADRTESLVSIIVPCYKQAHFLPQAIKSALPQTPREDRSHRGRRRLSRQHGGGPSNKYENTMKRYLAERFSPGRWNLCADIDELFDYPFSESRAIA
jgi:hypothetical protein